MFSYGYERQLLNPSTSSDLLVPKNRLLQGFRKRARHDGKIASRSLTHDGTLDLTHSHTTAAAAAAEKMKPNIGVPLLQTPRATTTSLLSAPNAPWTTIPSRLHQDQVRKQAPAAWKPDELLPALRRHETLTDPASDALVVAIIARATEELADQALRRNERLTDPAEDETVVGIVRRAAMGTNWTL